jgi:hypothetical protein
MAQYNVNPPDYPRETGVGTILAVLLVLALVAFLVWALAFGGFNSLTGAPAAPGTTSVSPSVNVNTGGSSAPSGGTTAPSSGTTAPSGGTGSTTPAKP